MREPRLLCQPSSKKMQAKVIINPSKFYRPRAGEEQIKAIPTQRCMTSNLARGASMKAGSRQGRKRQRRRRRGRMAPGNLEPIMTKRKHTWG